MKTRISIDDLIPGFQNSLQNANSLFQTANELADNNKYGYAISLLILASEEAIKAIMLLRSYHLGIIDYSELGEIFTRHKVKLDLIASLMWFAYPFKILMPEIERKLSEPTNESQLEIQQEIEKKTEQFVNWYREQLDNKRSDLWKIFSWWQKANNVKLSGLYVSWDNKWVSS